MFKRPFIIRVSTVSSTVKTPNFKNGQLFKSLNINLIFIYFLFVVDL